MGYNYQRLCFVLDIVRSGLKIDIFKRPVCYNINPSYSMSDTEKIPLTLKLRSCCRNGSLSQLPIAKGIFCQVFFTRLKAEGSHRVILNLKTYMSSLLFSLQTRVFEECLRHDYSWGLDGLCEF